jgi:predicted negative regulator of RcsB-dependent stress response
VDDLLTEKEQIEAIRSWWQINGRYVISGIVIGAGLLFGWNYWNAQQRNAQFEASALFETLLDAVADNSVAAAETTAAQLYDAYGETNYAMQGHLAMSRLYMDAGRDEDAAEELRALLTTKASPEMLLVARLRLAKILLYQDKPQEVVDLLQGYRDTAYGPRYNETLGDAWLALGRIEDAADAYTAALADNPSLPTVDRSLVQMKIYDLPELAASEAMEADAPDSAPANGEEAAVEPAENKPSGDSG